MLYGDVLQFGATSRPVPCLCACQLVSLAKSPVHACGVTGCRDGQGFQVPPCQCQFDVVQGNASVQGVDQWHAVKRGPLFAGRQGDAQCRCPAAELSHGCIGQVVDQMRMQTLPKRAKPAQCR